MLEKILIAANLLTFPLSHSLYAYSSTMPLEQRVDEIEKIVLKKKGLEITSYHYPIQLGNKKTYLNLRFEYLCGPRGGSGALRVLFYLDRNSWPSSEGIKEIRLFSFSPEATNMSVKEYEVNLNLHTNHITYEPINQRVLISDYFFDKTKEVIYKLFKKNKPLKEIEKNVEKAELAGNIVKTIGDYELREAVVEAGNLIIKDHVWLKEFSYNGYSFWDMDEKPRAPKAYELEIKTGECSIKGFFVKVVICNFNKVYFGKGELGTKKYEKGVKFSAPLDVERAAKVVGANPEIDSDAKE